MLNAMANGSTKLSKGELTSIRIQEAAVDLVIQNGIDGTTVEQICKVAEVSERTFFNHFKTKELAIIGDDFPKIDESKAREFLASPPGDIFTDALTLIPQPPINAGIQNLVFKRLQMMRQNPQLLAAQMEKLMVIREEHAQLIYLRLRRSLTITHTDIELHEMAQLVTEIVGSIHRLRIESMIGGKIANPFEKPIRIGEELKKLVDLGLNA